MLCPCRRPAEGRSRKWGAVLIYKRVVAKLRAQDWAAITIELGIVIVGVFIGTLVANWNEERAQRRETERLLGQLDVELRIFGRELANFEDYYRVVGTFTAKAEAGWQNDRSVSDSDFVVAAYQASQITGVVTDFAIWSTIFGAENMRDISDQATREGVARIMTFDTSLVDLRAVATRYREEVRKIIPASTQALIVEACGDRPSPEGFLVLPPACPVELEPGKAAETAAALRARRDLPAELTWHQAATANQLANMRALNNQVRSLSSRIARGG